MELQEYTTMFEAEDTHWWYRGLHELVGYFAHHKIRGKGQVRLLDAGCGTGGLLKFLGVDGSFGIDLSPQALSYCRRRGLGGLARASLDELPFAAGSFDIVVSLDVLYHQDVREDLGALRELCRVLAPGGMLILNLPAYEILRSSHDRAIHTRRRFTRSDVKNKLETCGMKKPSVFYRNSLLFPAAAAMRLFRRQFAGDTRESASDVKSGPKLINSLLLKIIRAENLLLRTGLIFPFGLSVFSVSQNRPEPESAAK